jgi:hypothetical protein
MALLRGQIVDQASVLVHDSNHQLVTRARKNDLLNMVQRCLVLYSKLSRNELILTFTAVNAVTQVYSQNGSSPTITPVNMSGWYVYNLSDLMVVEGMHRHLAVEDGASTPILPVNDTELDSLGLLGTGDRYLRYRMLDTNIFALYPNLNAGGYPCSIRITYRVRAVDMNDDTTDDPVGPPILVATPSVPPEYHDALIYGLAYHLEASNRHAELANMWAGEWSKITGIAISVLDDLTKDKKPRIEKTYIPNG